VLGRKKKARRPSFTTGSCATDLFARNRGKCFKKKKAIAANSKKRGKDHFLLSLETHK